MHPICESFDGNANGILDSIYDFYLCDGGAYLTHLTPYNAVFMILLLILLCERFR